VVKLTKNDLTSTTISDSACEFPAVRDWGTQLTIFFSRNFGFALARCTVIDRAILSPKVHQNAQVYCQISKLFRTLYWGHAQRPLQIHPDSQLWNCWLHVSALVSPFLVKVFFYHTDAQCRISPLFSVTHSGVDLLPVLSRDENVRLRQRLKAVIASACHFCNNKICEWIEEPKIMKIE